MYSSPEPVQGQQYTLDFPPLDHSELQVFQERPLDTYLENSNYTNLKNLKIFKPARLANNPKVELFHIIIPNYNNAAYLADLFTSLLENQPQVAVHLILIDDGSTDNSLEVIEQHLPQLEAWGALTLLKNDNQGVGKARNCGINAAIDYAIRYYRDQIKQNPKALNPDFLAANWITFIDSDDWVSSDYINQFVKSIGYNDGDVFVPMSRILTYYENSNTYIDDHEDRPNPNEFAEDYDHIPIFNNIPYTRVVARTGFRLDIVADQQLGFSTQISYGEDLVFHWSYCVCAHKLNSNAHYYINDEHTYYYRKGYKSLSSVLQTTWENSQIDLDLQDTLKVLNYFCGFYLYIRNYTLENPETCLRPHFLVLQVNNIINLYSDKHLTHNQIGEYFRINSAQKTICFSEGYQDLTELLPYLHFGLLLTDESQITQKLYEMRGHSLILMGLKMCLFYAKIMEKHQVHLASRGISEQEIQQLYSFEANNYNSPLIFETLVDFVDEQGNNILDVKFECGNPEICNKFFKVFSKRLYPTESHLKNNQINMTACELSFTPELKQLVETYQNPETRETLSPDQLETYFQPSSDFTSDQPTFGKAYPPFIHWVYQCHTKYFDCQNGISACGLVEIEDCIAPTFESLTQAMAFCNQGYLLYNEELADSVCVSKAREFINQHNIKHGTNWNFICITNQMLDNYNNYIPDDCMNRVEFISNRVKALNIALTYICDFATSKHFYLFKTSNTTIVDGKFIKQVLKVFTNGDFYNANYVKIGGMGYYLQADLLKNLSSQDLPIYGTKISLQDANTVLFKKHEGWFVDAQEISSQAQLNLINKRSFKDIPVLVVSTSSNFRERIPFSREAKYDNSIFCAYDLSCLVPQNQAYYYQEVDKYPLELFAKYYQDHKDLKKQIYVADFNNFVDQTQVRKIFQKCNL